jgi:endonuclease/exonuclease/phosphatase family metal-dependent hydrolase
LDPAWRVPALVQHITKLGADIFCLQEVEPETFVALRTFLGERGYGAQYARKFDGRPDGCAILYRRDAFDLISVRSFRYAGAGGSAADTGHIALVAQFHTGDSLLGVINTHLAWDPPDAARSAQHGLCQALQLVAEYEDSAPQARGWIVTGDFNATPGSEIVSAMEKAGFKYAHKGLPEVFTCNVGASARLIDYLFYSSEFHADPVVPATIDDFTILPSSEQPSDHVAITAKFAWKV